MSEMQPWAREFYEARIKPTLYQLLQKEYRLDDIQTLFDNRMQVIANSYPKMLWVGVCQTDNVSNGRGKMKQGSFITFQCIVENGQPQIRISLPSLKAVFDSFNGNPNQDQIFEMELVIGLIHELDHLALGRAERIDGLEERIANEALVWSITCITIGLLVKLGQVVDGEHVAMQTAWEKGGRNLQSTCWQDYIRGLYS